MNYYRSKFSDIKIDFKINDTLLPPPTKLNTEWIARKFPIYPYPLSQDYIILRNNIDINNIMNNLINQLQCINKFSKTNFIINHNKGKLKIINDYVDVDIRLYRDPKNKIYLEFNKYNGCTLLYRYIYLTSCKLLINEIISNENYNELYNICLKKIYYWYGSGDINLWKKWLNLLI